MILCGLWAFLLARKGRVLMQRNSSKCRLTSITSQEITTHTMKTRAQTAQRKSHNSVRHWHSMKRSEMQAESSLARDVASTSFHMTLTAVAAGDTDCSSGGLPKRFSLYIIKWKIIQIYSLFTVYILYITIYIYIPNTFKYLQTNSHDSKIWWHDAT